MNTFQITPDLEAELTHDDTSLLVRSEKHSDEDIYHIDQGEWSLAHDSLSNKDTAANEIWDNLEFCKWAEKMLPATA